MAVVDDLFELIRSLTPSEKRYFKIHAKTHVGDKYKNSYEKLFDAMNYWPDGAEYDEKLFKRKHKGKTFLKNLSAEKNYLYELILETMRSFHDKKTIDRQINDLLLDEDFFRKKRLNEHRKKAIDKAKKLATQYEKMPTLLTLLEREANMQIEWQPNSLQNLFTGVKEQEEGILNQLQTLISLRHLSNKLFVKVRITTNANKNLQDESQEIINDSTIINYTPGYSFWTDYHYYRLHAMHFRIMRNMPEYARYSKLIYELIEQNPHQKETNPAGYKIALYNYLNACFASGNLKPFPELLDKASSITASNKDEEGEDWQNLIHLKLIYLSNTAQLDNAIQLASEIETGLLKYKNKVNKARELALYYNLATACFIKQNWDKALLYYNVIVIDKTSARQDLKDSAELILLAIQYELNNLDTLQYLLRNTERKFDAGNAKGSHKPYFDFIKLLLNRKPIVKKADQKEILQLLKDRPELLYWVQSKIQNRNIEKIYMEQVSPAL